jgi:hypothetical protein
MFIKLSTATSLHQPRNAELAPDKNHARLTTKAETIKFHDEGWMPFAVFPKHT